MQNLWKLKIAKISLSCIIQQIYTHIEQCKCLDEYEITDVSFNKRMKEPTWRDKNALVNWMTFVFNLELGRRICCGIEKKLYELNSYRNTSLSVCGGLWYREDFMGVVSTPTNFAWSTPWNPPVLPLLNSTQNLKGQFFCLIAIKMLQCIVFLMTCARYFVLDRYQAVKPLTDHCP